MSRVGELFCELGDALFDEWCEALYSELERVEKMYDAPGLLLFYEEDSCVNTLHESFTEGVGYYIADLYEGNRRSFEEQICCTALEILREFRAWKEEQESNAEEE